MADLTGPSSSSRPSPAVALSIHLGGGSWGEVPSFSHLCYSAILPAICKATLWKYWKQQGPVSDEGPRVTPPPCTPREPVAGCTSSSEHFPPAPHPHEALGTWIQVRKHGEQGTAWNPHPTIVGREGHRVQYTPESLWHSAQGLHSPRSRWGPERIHPCPRQALALPILGSPLS